MMEMKLLYSLGARQLTFFGLGPMGCIPLQRFLTSTGACQESTNKLALDFNKAASKLLDDLSNTLPNASFKFGDAYDAFQSLIDRPYMFGEYTVHTQVLFDDQVSSTNKNPNFRIACNWVQVLTTPTLRAARWDGFGRR